ncbi:hypothetical protein [Micromonospora sp. NPDC047740]|uniref:hypothetical protein n=1 Tax=Micromonospora sp. NPDC047740 TaxID=3364254 RepID=UPI0037127B2A
MGVYLEITSMGDLAEMISNSGRFIGRPYGAYIIALATIVDEEALDWLYEYKEAMDSLTAELVAFMLFYNEAELKMGDPTAESHGPFMMTIRDIIDDNRFSDQLPLAHRGKTGFAISTTYGSDAVARELGIVDQLPCFVIFDDPSSNSGSFHTMPMTGDRSDFLVFRELMAKFAQDPANAEYWIVSEKWDRAAIRRQQLLGLIHGLKHEPARSSEVTEARKEVEEIDKKLVQYVDELNRLPKPALGPHIEKLLRRRRRSAKIKTLRRSATAMATNTPTVLDTVTKVASSLGYK